MSDVLLWIRAWTGCESIGQGVLMKHPWFPRPHQADMCVCRVWACGHHMHRL